LLVLYSARDCTFAERPRQSMTPFALSAHIRALPRNSFRFLRVPEDLVLRERLLGLGGASRIARLS
jgi:hypothetical protein